jgi:hypothetical protein
VLFPGLIYSDEGRTVGRLTGDGSYTNLQGQSVGFVSPDGYAYRSSGNDYILDGRLISSKMVVSQEGEFIGSVAPGGNITNFSALTIGFIKANGFAYNENKKALENISFEIKKGEKVAIIGKMGSGKSSIALLIAKDIQEKYTNKTVVVLDGEQTITDSHVERFKLDKSRLIVYKDSVLENMLDTAEAFSQSEDIGGIIIDSVKAFYSVAVEAKSAEDYSIGVEAKKLGTRLPIINANCARRKTALIVLNQWRNYK